LIEFPEKLQFLFEPYRYKVAYGGRGASKSWGFGRALLIDGAARPLRILCAREFQNSITDSVHKLLADQIVQLELQDFYQVLQTSIRAQNGTEFSFIGLRHNINNMKSYEGVDRCWVEEAQQTSRSSWKTLIPTIRKPDSEIWVSYNPDLEEDETHQRFVITPPDNAKVVKINWDDNPWFPDVLRQEMEYLKQTNYDEYLNVWEGQCKHALDGAIYANELRQLALEDRITSVPYNSDKPVNTFWDLGDADGTAIWFVQKIGVEYRVIDYYYNCHHKLGHYFEVLQSKPYLYEGHYLPHDADYDLLGQTETIKQQFETIYPNANVQIVEGAGKSGSLTTGIEAARNVMPQCWFDKEKTADGLHALRHYHYAKDQQTGRTSRQPYHDWSSHGASAFMYFAMSINKLSQTKNAPIIYSNKGIV
jgi:phage terminase large subunit